MPSITVANLRRSLQAISPQTSEILVRVLDGPDAGSLKEVTSVRFKDGQVILNVQNYYATH